VVRVVRGKRFGVDDLAGRLAHVQCVAAFAMAEKEFCR
jgi:hypothetical protein